jgi:AraC-like DNA-binding protein
MHHNKPLHAEFEKIAVDEQQSFFWKQATRKQFRAPYHYHPEYELIYIRRGYGRRLVSGAIEHFGPGDLVFLAPNVPHMWRVAPKCPQAETFYIQFSSGFVGEDFFRLPEMQPVRELMTAAQSGVAFSEPVCKEMAVRLKKISTLNTSERLLALMDILYRLSQDRDRRLLGRLVAGRVRLNRLQEDRISKAFQYLNQNLTGPISQAEIAQSVRLSPAAFSRLFKRTTGKRFVDVVKELRIAQTCRFLAETTRTVSEIAYECGYETLSHFNCQFQSVMNTTPTKYRLALETIHR